MLWSSSPGPMAGLDKALVAALGDKLPIRRAAAAVALCRAGALAQEPAVRKVVQDADLSFGSGPGWPWLPREKRMPCRC